MKHLILLTSAAAMTACSAQAEPAPQPEPAPQEAAAAAAPQRAAPADPKLTVEAINPNLHVIFGPGGNIGVSSGPDGVVMVDDKFARNADEILYRVDEITAANGASSDLLFVINTHLHGDHSGSNPQMKEAGALIMGHENIRKRMGMSYENKAFGRTNEAKDPSFFPVVTFTDRASLHFNGVTAHAIHTPEAHTDGDSIIHFVEPDVIHMGDNFFFGLFPFVDVDSGGSLPGMIASHDAALALAGPDTVIIPGHGELTDREGLEETRDILQTVLDRVRVRMDEGQSLQEIIDADPLADMAELESFIKRDGMITATWRSLGGAF